MTWLDTPRDQLTWKQCLEAAEEARRFVTDPRQVVKVIRWTTPYFGPETVRQLLERTARELRDLDAKDKAAAEDERESIEALVVAMVAGGKSERVARLEVADMDEPDFVAALRKWNVT